MNEEFRIVVAGGGEHRVHVRLEGELDTMSAPSLRDVLRATLTNETGDVDVDMSLSTFCDSSGLAVLLAAQRQMQLAGRQLRVVQASRPVLRLLDLSGARRLVGPPRSGDDDQDPPGQVADGDGEAGTS